MYNRKCNFLLYKKWMPPVNYRKASMPRLFYCLILDMTLISANDVSCHLSPWFSTILYGNIIVSTQSSSNARSKTAVECAVSPMCPIFPAALASISASTAQDCRSRKGLHTYPALRPPSTGCISRLRCMQLFLRSPI